MEEIIKLIADAKSVSIIPHIKADGDAIGSCLAMREVLRRLGKEAVIYTEEPVEQRLVFLDDDISVVYKGEPAAFDLCIVLDCGDLGRVSSRKPLLDAAEHVVNIDHHFTNTFFGDVNLVKGDASATGEILFELFQSMGMELDRRTAGFLYAAICSDTGCFAYSNVSSKTFRIAAELADCHINHAEIARMLFDCEDLNSELMKAELTRRIHSYYGGKLNIVTISEEETAKFGMKPEDIQDLVNLPRRIRGTEIAAALKQYDGQIRGSLRSNGSADVAAVALKFGGGGHTKSAGCTIAADTLEEAERLVVQVCKEALA